GTGKPVHAAYGMLERSRMSRGRYPRRRKKRRRDDSVTVGITGMAEGGRAMVLCADRQQTGDDMRHEGRIAKKREIGYGWRFLYEDSGTRADFLRNAVIRRLQLADMGRTEGEAPL